MSASNQQTLTDLGPNDRPLMLEKGNFIPWESRFRRFLDNKLEDGKRMWHSIQKGPYVRTMITDPDGNYAASKQESFLDHVPLALIFIQMLLHGSMQGHYARDCQKSRVCDAKYFKEQMLSAMKDEAESNCNAEENDFMLDNSFGDETLEELIVATVSEVNASYKDHEKVNNVKRKTIIHASDDDQIDSNVIFDDPYVENNGDTSEHDSNDHDEYHNIQILAYNVQREAKNQKRLNNELKKQKELLQKELETCKDRVKTFESKTVQCSKYKETCKELECEILVDKDTIKRILK
ncbi:hypothetical protein Tco_0475178 [Tanacetum coccineum]